MAKLDKIDHAVAELIETAITPGARKVGIALGPSLNILHRHLQLLDYKHNQFAQESLRQFGARLEQIEEKEVVPIVPEIACEVLERLPKTSSNELRRLYIELLTKAANQNLVDQVHPRFVRTISEISPAEAQILQRLFDQHRWTIPCLNIFFYLEGRNDVFYIKPRYWHDDDKNIATLRNARLMMENLTSIGMLEAMENKWSEYDVKRFEEMERDMAEDSDFRSFTQKLLPEGQEGARPRSSRFTYAVTDYGRQFMIAVCEERQVSELPQSHLQ